MKTGSIIKMLRIAEGVSQGMLAERLGVTRAYLSQVENNRRHASLLFLKNVSKEFAIPLALLVSGEDEGVAGNEVLSELRKLLSDLLSARMALSPRSRGMN